VLPHRSRLKRRVSHNMRLGIALFLFLLSAGNSFAEEADYVVPALSPLKYSSGSCEQYACFEGVITLNGSLIIGKEEDHRLRIVFVPDSKTRSLLPYHKGNGPVTEILVKDKTKQVLSLLPEGQRERIRVGEAPGVQFQATIVATEYQATAECDHWYYIIGAVVRIERISKPIPIQAKVASRGCG